MLALFLSALTIGEPTRADLAVAYTRFEHALSDHPPGPTQRTTIEREFDAATLDFFTGAGARALERIDRLAAGLDPERARNPAERAADALAVDVEPREVSASTGARLTLHVRRLRAIDDAPEQAIVRVVLPTATGRRVLAEVAIPKPFARESATVTIAIPGGGDFPDARIDLDVELEVAGARARRATSVALVGEPLAAIRARIVKELARVEPDGPPMLQASVTCRARAALLDPRPSANDSARFLVDLAAHAADVELEASALVAGRDPYRRRVGDLWRVVRLADGSELPVRVHAPRSACGDARVPLIIALHGAGGDENMFLEGYGLGTIRDLADQHGFVVACPRAGFTGTTPAAFDAIVEALLYTHAIDVKRVHVVGHSMGAGSAAALRIARSDRIASVVLLAGASRDAGGPTSPPMFLAGGELDPLASPASLRRAADNARAAGARVEYTLVEARGHTLFVGEILPHAIQWCLERKLP